MQMQNPHQTISPPHKKRRSDFRIPSGLQEDTPLKKHRLVLFSVDIRQDATARLQVSSF